ncbi:MAG: hypothetical protein RLZZ53_2880, partial [Acidobacteriota bacterium]
MGQDRFGRLKWLLALKSIETLLLLPGMRSIPRWQALQGKRLLSSCIGDE